MIKFSILGSGSKGNSIYVDIDGFRLLVDAGFTKKETQRRLTKIGRQVNDVQALCGCHTIVIETNYDIDMLAGNQAYPTELLERIASERGHLRNECAADVIAAVAWPGLQYVVGWHLSGKNNHEALVMQLLQDAVRDVPGCQVVISRQSEPTKLMAIL